MKIKASYQILGQTYRFKLASGLIERDGIEGYVDPHSYLICVDSSLKKNRRVFDRVLAHELAHAYCLESGLHETLSATALEMVCQTMSSFICQMHLKSSK